MVRSHSVVGVGHPYSGSLGMQSSQTPAMANAAKSHATTQTNAAPAMMVVRTAGFMRPKSHSELMSAMAGKRTSAVRQMNCLHDL